MATGLLHDGFYIPNAGDPGVSNPRMAEPDRVDFNTLASTRWGVVEGCAVSVAGTTASTSGGTFLVNGQLITLKAGSVSLGSGGAQDRFDLIVGTAGGDLTVKVGTEAVDPVFPDPPVDTTVFAAVFCSGGGPFSNNVVDKRVFVPKALLTKIAPGDPLIRNLNGSGNHFLLGGDGRTTWANDTWMWRSSPETLSVHKHLLVDGTLTANGDISVGGGVEAQGPVTGGNLHWAAEGPSGAAPGAIWQNPSSSPPGKIYVWRSNAWQEIATIQSANPPGTVIQSFEKPTVMSALGWLPLDGRKINETDYPTIFAVQGMASLIDNGVSPRTMLLPDARRRVLRTDFDLNPGTAGGPNINNLVSLQTTHMPRHGHNPQARPGGGISPTIKIQRNGKHGHKVYGGEHGHNLDDPGHQHHGMDLGGGIDAAVIALMWGGQNKIDALFNDRNHTYSVEAMEWSARATTGIKIGSDSSSHLHSVDEDGDHDHIATISQIPDHPHNVSEDLMGNNTPFDITPEFITVYAYVRS